MTRTLASPDSVASTPFVARKRRRTKEEMEAAEKEVAEVLATARKEKASQEQEESKEIAKPFAIDLPNETPSPQINGEFIADVLEFHQPVELMGNQKTLSHARSIMTRLSDGTGDWLIVSKKTKHRYLVSGGNVKAAKLK